MRGVIAAALLVLVATGCDTADGLDLHSRFEAGGTGVDVRVIVQPEHRRDAPRYLHAAIASLGTLQQWLGAVPRASMTILDPPLHATPTADPSVIVLDRTPWWSSPTTMSPELATARAVGRRCWAEMIDMGALPSWFVDGLVELTARRIVTPLFQGENLFPGYAMVEERYFAGMVPHFVRIRLLPESDGEPLSAYRARPRVAVSGTSLSSADRRSLTAKTVLTLNTLERWLSQPVFDGALAQFVRTFRSGRPTIEEFERLMADASGEDLSWFFAQTLDGSAAFDFAVAELTSERNASGAFDTSVTVARLGPAMFTGTSAPRVGPFESGRGMTLLVAFEDGARAVAHWDSRDERKTYTYRSEARALSATIDPDRVLLLDVDRTNNSRTLAARNGAAANRWAARWMLWLENVLLTYAALA